MAMRFDKMHGLGNDFVILDARQSPMEMTSALAKRLADRQTGIGCDQLILLEPSDGADLRMRIFNADGSEVEQCGNALRCVAQLTGARRIDSTAGLVEAEPGDAGITIDMGAPRFGWEEIPLAYALDTAAVPVGWDGLEQGMAVNVGNPHIVFFVPKLDAIDLERLGPTIEHDPLFPERVNVNVAEVTGSSSLKLRVWERGAGLTHACGTGACATAVAAIRRGLVQSPVTVSLPGGDLGIDWAPGRSIRMTGPATHVFAGEAELEAFG